MLGAVHDGWDVAAWVFTAIGCVTGVGALVLTVLIFRWTSQTDSERHSELTDAVTALGDVVRAQAESSPGSTPEADLAPLSATERSELEAELQPDEEVVRLQRARPDRADSPWLAATSSGRVIGLYRGRNRDEIRRRVVGGREAALRAQGESVRRRPQGFDGQRPSSRRRPPRTDPPGT